MFKLDYRRYGIAILIGAVLTFALWMGLVRFQMGAPTESSRWIHEVMVKKQAIAHKKTGSPRILLLSGSNGHFGLNARMIEQATGIPTVNISTHAGLDLAYLLRSGRLAARPGDIIVMPLEYELYTYTAASNEILIDYVFSRDPQYLSEIGFRKRMQFMLALPAWKMASRVRARFKEPARLAEGYQSETVDAWGDETHHSEKDRTPAMIGQIDGETPAPELMAGIPNETLAWDEIVRFAGWCEQNRVTLLATYPNLLYFKAYRQAAPMAYFDWIERNYRRLGIPVIGSPWAFMFDRNAFYDTRYHLTEEATRISTQRLIDLLRPYLAQR
jgi:hypothetical protein